MKQRFSVTGMTCSACSVHIEKSVNKLEGITSARVNLLTNSMEVEYEEGIVQVDMITEAVKKAGYGAEALHQSGQVESEKGQNGNGRHAAMDKANEEEVSMRVRLLVSLAFLLPLMYVAMYHMFKDWFGIPIPGFIMDAFHGNENAVNFVLTQLLLVLPILYVNRKFFIVGFRTLFRFSPNMDSLVAIGSAAAVGYGIFAMYRISYGLGHGDMTLVAQYSHDLYFESAGMILTLITLGKYLESRSKGKTSEAITKLMDLSPKTAIILNETGEEEEVPTDSLISGSIFLVKPGSLIPADGTVLVGSSSVDEAAITGESIPVEKQPGDKVVSATVNKAGFLQCRADRVGEDTTLSQIIRLVEEASASKAPIAQLADKISGVFVPVVIGIALITLAVWLLVGAGAEFAISVAIAVLVISCPCALGLATPVAIMVGTGVGAKHGILIKSGEALQEARSIDTVVLDKTGTITEGKLHVEAVITADASMTEEKLLLLAAALEKKSEHPLAEAIVKAAAETGKPIPEVTDFQAVFGRGVEGRIAGVYNAEREPLSTIDNKSAGTDKGDINEWFYVGNQAFMKEKGILLNQECMESMQAMADTGRTPLLVAGGKGYLGLIGVADRIKASSGDAIQAMQKMGIHVIMLTGDNSRTAEAVRKQLAMKEVIAEVLPQDKERHITELKKKGHKVAMVGDGINDAPALAAADVGIAIGAGTDVAIESADIILMKNDLRDAVTAIRLSKSVIRNIKQNLFWAFFYNIIGIPIAAGVLFPLFAIRLSPMLGAAAMSLSSVFVVGNALRLKGFHSSWQEKDKIDTPSSIAMEATRSHVKSNQDVNRATESQMDNQESEIIAAELIPNKIKQEETRMTRTIIIEGMSCGHCTGRVKQALEAVNGVTGAEVSLENKTAFVTCDQELSEQVLTQTVTEAGYEVVKIS